MALKLCSCGVLSGIRHHCDGRRTTTLIGPSGHKKLDKREKRRIDQAMRDAGTPPARELQ